MPIVEALVLAAGFSSRMKAKNKMLLEIHGQKIIQHTIEYVSASMVTGITLVLGFQKEQLRQEIYHQNVRIIENPCFKEGMGASIREGIKQIMARHVDVDAVLIVLGDMPFIKPETINHLLQVYESAGGLIVMPEYEGRRGHPVLFDKKAFSELTQLTGDAGARNILKKYANDIILVEVDDPGIHMDIDCWEDYVDLIN